MLKNNSSNKILGYLFIFFGIFFTNFVDAFPIILKRESNSSADQNEKNEIVIRKIVAGVAVIIGFCTCFFGHRLYTKVIFFIGFFAGSYLARSIILSLKSNINVIILFICTYIIGLICGTLAIYVYKFSLCILGILAACCVNNLIITFFPIIGEKINPLFIIIFFSIIFIVLIFICEVPVIIISTAIAGSFMMIYCLDILIDAGLTRSLQNMYSNNKFKNGNSVGIYSLNSVSILVAVLGCIVQFRYHSQCKN